MSAVMAEGGAAAAEPVKKSRKKLLIMVGGLLLVLAVLVAVGVTLYLRNKAAHAAAEEAGDDAEATHAAAKIDPKHAPAYLPLDPFVINLADKNVDRYAQIGITLELDNPAFADEMRAYMPAVRNAILMVLAHKSSADLLDRSGKEELATEIRREAVRPMGIEPAEAEMASAEPMSPASAAAASAPATKEATEAAAKPKAKMKKGDHNPVSKVHFSTFIIQ